jgi:DUF4097 and DUF4098 domain-containing protein YvlB
MLGTLALGLLTAVAPVQQMDTTFAVDGSDKLELYNMEGEIHVTGWNRSDVRIVADIDDEEGYLSLNKSGSTIKIKTKWKYGPSNVDYVISVPKTMALNLHGVSTDVYLEDVRGEVTVETIEGEIGVRGGSGIIDVRTIEGEITIRDARGSIRASTAEDDITIVNVVGEIFAETFEGDIVLDDVDSGHVQGSTLDGDIHYNGTIHDGGRYRLTTHDGDVRMVIPANANATVVVASVDGDFETDFPIEVTDYHGGHRLKFVLGSGAAHAELETFDGSIQLVRQ